MKKKSYVPVGKIKKHLRRLSIQRPEYSKARNRAKVDTAVFKCEKCGQLMYHGKSSSSFDKKKETYPDILWETPELDHINSVVDVKDGWQGWDEYINRLFCGPDDLLVLCKACHKGVSSEEMNKRKQSGSLKRSKNE